MARFVLAAVLTLMLVSPDRLRTTLDKTVVMSGGSLRLTCHVPTNPANRRLAYGVLDFSVSERMLDGEHALVTWSTEYKHIPCGLDTAYCLVLSQAGSWTRDVVHFEVAGCN